MFSPLHFMLYRGKSISFESVGQASGFDYTKYFLKDLEYQLNSASRPKLLVFIFSFFTSHRGIGFTLFYLYSITVRSAAPSHCGEALGSDSNSGRVV